MTPKLLEVLIESTSKISVNDNNKAYRLRRQIKSADIDDKFKECYLAKDFLLEYYNKYDPSYPDFIKWKGTEDKILKGMIKKV